MVLLKALDSADLARVEAAEAHLSVQAEELATLRARIDELELELNEAESGLAIYRDWAATDAAQRSAANEERDRLARELEEARKPDPDLERLRRLEVAAQELRDALPPTRAEARWMWQRCVAYLTPHLG